MTTKAQIIKRALVRAGVVAVDQTPTAEQNAQAAAVLDSLHEKWIDDGVARWELAGIPQALDNAIVARLAFALADDFAVPSDRYQRLAIGDQQGAREIAAYNEVPGSGVYPIQEF